jgi:hypothetical protein
MIDIVGKLEKRVKLLCRTLFIGYLIFFDYYINNSINSINIFVLFGIMVCYLIVEHFILFAVRWVYKIEPESIIEILQELGVKDIYKEMKTFSYSEDYIRSLMIIPNQSQEFYDFKNRYYSSYGQNYKFSYITLFNNKNKSRDQIEAYKLLQSRDEVSKSDLKRLLLSIRLELSYVDNQFVLKNNYTKIAIDSLHMNESLYIFNKFIDDIKILFNPKDFEQLMKDSYFEFDLRFFINRNLLTKSEIDKTFSYGLNIQWSDRLASMHVLKYKDCFRSGEAIRIHDSTRVFEEAKINNKISTQHMVEKHCYSNIFQQIFNTYQDEKDRKIINYVNKLIEQESKNNNTVSNHDDLDRRLDYQNPDDVLSWKKSILKRKKVLFRYSRTRVKVKQSKWLQKIKLSALRCINKKDN